MRMESPLTVFCRSRFPTKIIFRSRTSRVVALLGVFVLASLALVTAATSAGSLRRLVFGVGAKATRIRQPQTRAALNPIWAAAITPQSGSTMMTTERRGHTATILADGRALIVGGENAAGGILNSAEIFVPATNTFSSTGSLTTGRSDHAAVRLADGRVLVTGGLTATGPTNTTEIFDSATGVFTSGQALGVARAAHSATLFADGRVLIAGGDGSGSAEIFDPSTGSSVAGALT